MRKINVLVCPLDWGLGHATRQVPVIKELIYQGFQVIMAADRAPLALLQNEFPQLQSISFPSFQIRYSKSNSQVIAIFLQIPKIIKGIISEHYQLKKIISKYKIDLVISDNRYGLWHKQVHTVFVTHQICIQFPSPFRWLEFPIYLINRWFIQKYNRCWIPDFPAPNSIAGNLITGRKLPNNTDFIGILSRFDAALVKPFEFEILCILSGPENQRSVFEEILIQQISNTQFHSVIVRGTSENHQKINKNPKIKFVNIANTDELKKLINTSWIIICRSGYSSIMDLVALKLNAILVPTPGQTEQEYLAKFVSDKFGFVSCSQKDFDLKTMISKFELAEFQYVYIQNRLLKEAVNKLRGLNF